MMTDLISRQDAIDALKEWYDGAIAGSFGGIEKTIRGLPSVQPEILACGEGELNTQGWIPCEERLLPSVADCLLPI